MIAEDLATWLRNEHDKVDKLAARLHERVAVIPKINLASWIADVTAAFEHIRAHILKHQALEEQDGYMLPVVEQRPALSVEIERLAHEHGEMGRLMCDIHCQLQELTPADRLLIRYACRRIQNFLQYLEHHQEDENLLVLSAYMNDTGIND